jgi:alginate O-acetyltransferase complex protein AlgI
MMPQFSDKKTFHINYEKISLGLIIFAIGLTKKVLIANPLGEYADTFFNAITPESTPSFANSWLGTLAYTFQIYFDFSGYTDMAIGISLLFGIKLPINFNAPYQATGIIDFWRRWHISLSSFLRDYLYIPLGGNQRGVKRRYVNLLITMVLGGLWHGANWTFILWGLAHGLLLTINHIWRTLPISKFVNRKSLKPLWWLITFITVCLTWILFRVDHVDLIYPIYQGLIGLNGFDNIKITWDFGSLKASTLYILIAISLAIIWLGKPSHQLIKLLNKVNINLSWLSRKVKLYGGAIAIFFLIIYCINKVGEYNPFLYFQF